MNNVNICIVHFNTPKLTECLVRSINKFTPNSTIYIFDNSNLQPFTYKQDNIVYIDNTKGQIIDFDEWLKSIPTSRGSAGAHNKWASAKHCYTIQKCIEMINEPFILLDSDVLVKKDLSELIDTSIAYAGESQKQVGRSAIKRVLPYCLYFNPELLKEYNITFYNQKYCHGLNRGAAGDNYDTGAWFYTAAENAPHKVIKYSDYVVHYGKGSWKNMRSSARTFLEQNKKLWADESKEERLFLDYTKNETKAEQQKKAPKSTFSIKNMSSSAKRLYQRQKLYNFIYG